MAYNSIFTIPPHTASFVVPDHDYSIPEPEVVSRSPPFPAPNATVSNWVPQAGAPLVPYSPYYPTTASQLVVVLPEIIGHDEQQSTLIPYTTPSQAYDIAHEGEMLPYVPTPLQLIQTPDHHAKLTIILPHIVGHEHLHTVPEVAPQIPPGSTLQNAHFLY